MVFASVSVNPTAVFSQTVKSFECDARFMILSSLCLVLSPGPYNFVNTQVATSEIVVGFFFLFFVVSSEFETLLWLCHHSDVFGNDGKQINTVISSCLVCRLIFSVAELRRSYIMAAARCVSSNSIYELFHIYLDWKP